jgi:hypothetical protein
MVLKDYPARLYAEQAATYLGFKPHDIPVLLGAGLLKPLGGSWAAQMIKYFATAELEKLRRDTPMAVSGHGCRAAALGTKECPPQQTAQWAGFVDRTIRVNRPKLSHYFLTSPPLGARASGKGGPLCLPSVLLGLSQQQPRSGCGTASGGRGHLDLHPFCHLVSQ